MQRTLLFGITALAHTATASVLVDFSPNALLLPRQESAEKTYIDSVCSPNTTSTVPPCQAIINIESACTPNGTTSNDYLAHQQCMCNGGFFSSWDGCLNCQYVHGSRSEAEAEAYSAIISTASSSLCTGTPTAGFAAIFSAVSNTAPLLVSGAPTTTSDLYPSDAAVSLYYTASGPQGAGVITGNAASATASGTASSSASGGTSSSTTALSGTRTTAGSSSKSVTGSSTGNSAATKSASTSTTGSGTRTTAAATTSATQSGEAVAMKALGGVGLLAVGGLFFTL